MRRNFKVTPCMRTTWISPIKKGGLIMPDAESTFKSQGALNSEEYLWIWSSRLEVLYFCLQFHFTVILVIQNYKWSFHTFSYKECQVLSIQRKILRYFQRISNEEWNNSFPEFPANKSTSRYITTRILCSISFSWNFQNLVYKWNIRIKKETLCYFCKKRVSLTRVVFAGDMKRWRLQAAMRYLVTNCDLES